MNVEDALDTPMLTDFETAAERIRASGPGSCYVMGAKGKVADRLTEAGLPFYAWAG